MATLNKIYQRILDQHCAVRRIILENRAKLKGDGKFIIVARNFSNTTETIFEKILIANRGEIACRIIKTAKEMGIKTVAIYSTADRNEKHVKLADEAFCIGPPIAKFSYLDVNKILDAVAKTNAEAVHPGYGFLSENPRFVQALEKQKVTFIGPSAKTIAGMGDKLESKRLAMAAGVNTIPGFDGIIMDENHCIKIANSIGYPVIIKASAGGGGKGMRVARNDKDSRTGFKLATEEAQASFGDGRILLEKFIEEPRHIEIQILGDKHGNIVHLNERECSIQRRNQKIIEEAPSTFLDKTTRELMGQQAISLCKQIGYYSAGTVEFLVDKRRNFYFLEMNTRLQVEHPVTEFITGINLVHEMIRIAKGHRLKLKQNDVKIKGWAIESRIYAEDPYKNFGLPNTGHIYAYKEPNLDGVRCDSGVEEGSIIGVHYDPLISKLICHGSNREEAIERSIKSLDSYLINGVKHNVPLLRDILAESRFRKGETNTNYLSEVYPDGFKGRKLDEKNKKTLVTVALGVYATQELRCRLYLNGPSVKIHAKGSEQWDLLVTLLGEDIQASVTYVNNDSFLVKFKDGMFKIKKNFSISNPMLMTYVNDEPVTAQLLSKNSNGEFEIVYKGTAYKLRILTKLAADLLKLTFRKPKVSNTSSYVKSPMPGLVKNVSCESGTDVVEGQELCVVEAMKMQNSMVAERNGKIKRIYIKEGDTVAQDDVLMELE